MFGFTYSKDAVYFVTACCKNRIHHFAEVHNGEMHLNNFGLIACDQILRLASQYPYVALRNFIVMPNHIHIVFKINYNFVQKTASISPDFNSPVRMVCDLSLHKIKLLHQKKIISRTWQQNIVVATLVLCCDCS